VNCQNRMRLKFRSAVGFLLIAVIVGGISGAFTTSYLLGDKNQEELIAEFYAVETAVSVSPHHIRKGMAKGDNSFILVDLRSEEEYIEEHIVTAVNIPAYKNKDHSDYGAVGRIVSSFKELRENNLDKEIIVYCYSGPCMTGRKVGKLLSDNEIYVKHLGIGWNEWRYHWTIWNHPHEWEQTDALDYVISGNEPGIIEGVKLKKGCPIEGGLGC
jgi:rhodanese-related sulfurtransferase